MRSGRIIDEVDADQAGPEEVLWKLFHSEDGVMERRASMSDKAMSTEPAARNRR